MLPKDIFRIDMVLGYLACALCIATYVWPRLTAMGRVEAHRAIATFNSFRFFGLVFLLPGFVGPNLPGGFAAPAAYGDLATGLLAILALLTVRVRSLFWPLVWAFNLVGLADLVVDTVNAWRLDVPSVAGQLGAGYAIPILYVPALVCVHLLAFWLLLRPAYARVRSASALVSSRATE
jgi:hypothetical protein